MKLRHLITSAMALILMSACTDDATGVLPDDLAGSWAATAIVFTSVEDPTMTADIVDEGATATFVLDADGSYTLTFTFEEENELETGTYAVDGDTLTLTPTDAEEDPETWTIVRDGDTMTLTTDDDFEFENDISTDVTMVITLTR